MTLYDKVYDLFHQWLNTTDEDFEEFCDWISNQDVITLNITGSSFNSYNDSPFTYTGNIFVDWGDNTGLIEYNGGQLNHSYSSNGNYTIKIYGNITALNYACFQQCIGLTSVTIPYNVTRLGNASFWGCSNLISVTLPNTITYIGSGCFADCTSLTSVNIPDSVTSMGTCFSGDTALTEVILNWNNASEIITYDSFLIDGCTLFEHFLIPQGTTSLYTAKSYPNNLLQEKPLSSQLKQKFKKLSFFTHYPKEHETLTINNVTEEYPSKKEIWGEWLKGKKPLVFTFTGTTLTQYSSGSFSGTDMVIDYGDGTIELTNGTFGHTYAENGTYTVKIYGVTSLGGECFRECTGLTSINISSNVTSIEGSCFYNCSDLTSINIPSSVTSIGHSCFYGCSGLTSIIIPSSITSLDSLCFYKCSNLTNITIPSSVTSLGDYCFDKCSNLTSINIPSSVTSIGVRCFDTCNSLTNITIPSSVTNLGIYCFQDCDSLEFINLNWTTDDNIITYKSNWVPISTRFIIPNGTKQLYFNKGYPEEYKLQEKSEPSFTIVNQRILAGYASSCQVRNTRTASSSNGKTVYKYRVQIDEWYPLQHSAQQATIRFVSDNSGYNNSTSTLNFNALYVYTDSNTTTSSTYPARVKNGTITISIPSYYDEVNRIYYTGVSYTCHYTSATTSYKVYAVTYS